MGHAQGRAEQARARCRGAVQHPGFGNHAEEDRRFACRCARRRPADAHDVRRAVRMWRASNRSSLRAGVGCARLLWSSVQAATTTGRIEENTMSVTRFLRAGRKSVVLGKSVLVRVDLGGRRFIKKKNQELHENYYIKKT